MYHLITFPAGFGTISYSPFCIKAAWMLNHAGVAWEREDTKDPRKTPNGKLPVLRAGDQLVPDSDNIRSFLEDGGADFWGATSARDRAFGQGLIRMAEDHMYFYGAVDRWMDDAVWPATRDEYFDEIPAPIRKIVAGKLRRDLRKSLTRQGLLRLSPEDRRSRLEADLNAITTLLDGRAFLLGDTPTLPDFSVGAILTAMHTGPKPTVQTRRVSEDPVLMGYVDRMRAAYE